MKGKIAGDAIAYWVDVKLFRYRLTNFKDRDRQIGKLAPIPR
ncbi:MAG: hypothetical protein SAJ12_13465 [Jaaginema sp. PMC 1079.18]|nr:hypothetical protein [Jaaginema sp. PMC 1080.18]MEC4851991.1 hypothetical protein [Jaaginema sp. PMC 1079.18]MEC4867803.1 hypothetical protein [Jaaginema sp. PMC 1078.18]